MSINVLIRSAGNKFNLIREFQKYADVYVQDRDPKAKCFLWAEEWSGSPIDLVIEETPNPICLDKYLFYQFCKRHGFNTPVTGRFTALVKLRNGSGSREQFKIDERKHIIQEIVDWPEYSIDYFADEYGNPLSVIPRKRLDVLNGEATRAEIDYDPILVAEGMRMGQELDIRGPATMQLFFNGKNVKWIEVNPRFGGGSHLTWHIFSGPKWMVEHCMDKSNVSRTPEGNQVS